MSRSLLGGRAHQITHANVDIELACVAGVIGEGEGEPRKNEKSPSFFLGSPSPSPITPATQANIELNGV